MTIVRSYDNDDDKDGEGKDYGDQGADDLEGEAEEHPEVHGYGDVHDVDLLGKAVKDPSNGRRVKEGHRSADDAGKERPVELGRGQDCPHHDRCSGEHDAASRERAEEAVDAEVHVLHGLVVF